MVTPRPDPEQIAASVREGITRLAQTLYSIDSMPELALVRDRAQLRGRSAEVAEEAGTLVDGLWTRYPQMTEAGEQLDAAAGRDRQAIQNLLQRTGAPSLLRSLEADAQRASTLITQLGTAWRNAVPRLDALRSRLAEAAEAAGTLGMPGDPELAAARTVVDDATAQATADPLGADLDDAERLVQRVEERLAGLAKTRATIGGDLDAAEARVEELAQLIQAGHGARAAAEDRIVDAGGLVAPLDPAALDDVRSRLDRLKAQARAGAWPAAAQGLAQWQEQVDELRTRAGAVAAANRAPLERRNDLRGLLEAFRAKAAALGLAEDPALTKRYRSAHEALYAYRCDVRAAEILVREYGRAIETP